MSEQISILNLLLKQLDEKAANFKQNKTKMREAQRFAEKKLLLDLIDQVLQVSGNVIPKPIETIDDVQRLKKQLEKMG